MKNTTRILLFLCSGLMGLIWRFSWANYFSIAAFHRPFPLPEAIGTLGLGSLLVSISLERGWRIIWVLILQVLGFAVAFLRIVYVFYDWSFPFLDPHWIAEFAGSARGLMEWMSLFFLLTWTIIFWFAGYYLVRRPGTYYNTCTRFDIGVAFLLTLFLLKYVLWYRGGIEIPDPLSGSMLAPFFLFSLLAIALARNRSDARREYMPGYRGMGVIIGFVVVTLLLGSGVISLLLPYLTLAAKAGYGVMKVAAGPLGSFMVGILRFIFQPRAMRSTPESSMIHEKTIDSGPSMDTEWWTGPIGDVVRFLFIGLFGLITLVLVVFILWLLYKWLISRINWLLSRTPDRRRDQLDLLSLLKSVLYAFSHLLHGIIKLVGSGKKDSVWLYSALLKWGRHSGMSHVSHETPLEYGLRLKNHFPAVGDDIDSIIGLFNLEVYGVVEADDKQLALGIRSWRRMRSPVHWVKRLSALLLQPDRKGL